ncbi:MAG: DUF4301 family protein [Bacteroidales bacterium]|nr:DUF4301 family protein [Bacteroidales bacterium]
MLTDKDKALLSQKGIETSQVEKQLQQFKSGFPFADIQRAATIGDGISAVDEAQAITLSEIYEKSLAHDNKKVVKFIPASGAATRMFKQMFEFRNAEPEKQKEMESIQPWAKFLSATDKFAFGDALDLLEPKRTADKIRLMLDPEGLGYGQKPKGVILFHHYPKGQNLTAAEEHIIEGVHYACVNNEVNLHFTVSPQHLDLFKEALKPTQEFVEKHMDIKTNISFSFQKPSTDTLAATMDNEPFRDAEGNLVFRPGGHGALIENLGDIDADYVFIKNIDNVAQQHLLPVTSKYKKVIAGYAVQRKKAVDEILLKLDKGDNSALKEAEEFINRELKLNVSNIDAKTAYAILDRPLRVCGMVKNEGEPGGGPFWTKGSDGAVSLQVVESAQIDPKDADLMKQSTHFNPVDLFCCITDRNGKRYNLKDFVDPNAGFISYKSLNGKDLKAMELPGLWNGAMAKWLTFFVEVPVETFNPVKTVMDLLRPQHQPA